MVSGCISTSVFCITAVILSVLLKQYSREQSLMLSIGACAAILGGTMIYIESVIYEIRDILSQGGISEDFISIVFKSTAICFITQITCEICRESNEYAIASACELWGKTALTVVGLPVLRKLIEIIDELL